MKVLIISHLPMATQNNMGRTFLSLFSQFDQEELCQLYIYPAIPDVDRCSSYYRVTDKEVLSSFLGKRNIGGEIDHGWIRADQGLYEKESDEGLYRNWKNKSPVRRLLRDAMWAMSPWYGRGLKNWLEREKPDCIFVAPGAAKFLYSMALRISKERQIPIIPYICDEYYFVREPEGLLEKLRLGLLQRKIRQLMKNTSHLVVISRELEEAYGSAFGVDTTVLMTGTSYPIAEVPRMAKAAQEICYFGNIRCNRYLVLAEIGRELDAINEEQGTDYKLNIFSSEKDAGILSSFDGIASVVLRGFVAGAEFDRIFREAQLLLHAEAFDEESKDFTKHSVSTKIADSLASGIPLLAYGPEEISSMRHLLRHDCAVAATSPEALRQSLLTALEDGDARNLVAKNGILTARKYHDTGISGFQLKNIVLDVIRKT